MSRLESYCPRCNVTTINVLNVDPCDGPGAYEPVRCPNLVIKQDLGGGESLCLRHDLAARQARERDARSLRALARTLRDDDEAFYRDERPDRAVRKPTLEELLRLGPPLHRRVLEVRRELEDERRPGAVNECPAPVPVEDMIARVSERDDDFIMEKLVDWPQGRGGEEAEGAGEWKWEWYEEAEQEQKGGDSEGKGKQPGVRSTVAMGQTASVGGFSSDSQYTEPGTEGSSGPPPSSGTTQDHGLK
ncbi:hypothetical protein SLS62_008032 [Diatrype stigma]|uniref:Uncharacterized protein n=1 Tax=Diatrype stigma TaxID=117547 RepID=A0AAN9UKM5_9PEZI